MTIGVGAENAGTAVNLERLEAEIVGLASQLAAASCRLLMLVNEYDAAEGWRSWGLRGTWEWLAWQCGLGPTAAREQVRVARALRYCPALTAEFAAGRLSYSKVRAITRIATAQTEATLAEWARFATAAQMEQLAARQRRVARRDDAAVRRAQRYLRWAWDEDGSLVGSFRLPPEDAAILLQALARNEVDPVEDAGEGEPEQKQGNASAEESGTTLVHASPEDPRLPGERLTPPQLSADGLVRMASRSLSPASSQNPVSGVELVVHAPIEALDRDPEAPDDGPGVLVETAPGLPPVRVHHTTGQRLTCSCPGRVQVDDEHGNPLHLGRRTRRLRSRLTRAVHTRDGGRCRAPGCTRTTSQIHHVWHWARGGPTCLTNLVSLCDRHHWLVHEGGWHILTGPDGHMRWVRGDGRHLPNPPRMSISINRSLDLDDPAVALDAIAGESAGDALSMSEALYALDSVQRTASASQSSRGKTRLRGLVLGQAVTSALLKRAQARLPATAT